MAEWHCSSEFTKNVPMKSFSTTNSRGFRTLLLVAFVVLGNAVQGVSQESKPNIIILFADDLGYGDLSCYGHPTIRTKNLDAMAREGLRFTSFYAAASVCTPSRAGLLTGRYPIRSGMHHNTGPGSSRGIPQSEILLSELLKTQGYRTMAVGKWHLGHSRPEQLPTGNGFDQFFGLPYSNDMRPPWVQTDVPLKLYRGTTAVEYPVHQRTLTVRYTREAVQFIKQSGNDPLFLYLAYSMPHLPVRTEEKFRGQSRAGLYGDVIETIDWSVGRILQALREQGIDEKSWVVFTSDNGPWLNLPDRMLQDGNERWHAGSPGPLRDAKGSTYEGGFRVPCIMWWPGRIAPGRTTAEPVSSLDLYATAAQLAGAQLPQDRVIDSHSLVSLMDGSSAKSPREWFFYFRGGTLEAVRHGAWKLRQTGGDAALELYQLDRDPGERYNVASREKEKLQALQRRFEEARTSIVISTKVRDE